LFTILVMWDTVRTIWWKNVVLRRGTMRDLGAATALGSRPVPFAVTRFLPFTGPVTASTAAATAPAGGSPPSVPGAGPRSGPRPASSTPESSTTSESSLPLGTAGVHADLELPAVVLSAVQRVDRVLGIALVEEPDESEAPASPGVPLLWHVNVSNVSVFLKQRS